MRHHHWLLAALVLLGLWFWTRQIDNGELHAPVPATSSQDAAPLALPPVTPPPAPASGTAANYPAFLPVEAHDVLQRIARGGPFEYRQDGGVFQNRERLLPSQPRGYYREYTVETPGSPDRGPRRIVTGGNPPVEYFYTDDHYRSFQRFQIDPIGVRQ